MLKTLIALDGSVTSEQALTLAGELLGGKETETMLLHVIPRHLIYGKGGPVVAECYDPAEEQTASKALLEASEKTLRESGVGPVIHRDIEVGDPAHLILDAALEEGSDLIIMGSRGLNAAQRFLLGSVSTKVASHAHCAVLVAHPKPEPEPIAVDEGREAVTV